MVHEEKKKKEYDISLFNKLQCFNDYSACAY